MFTLIGKNENLPKFGVPVLFITDEYGVVFFGYYYAFTDDGPLFKSLRPGFVKRHGEIDDFGILRDKRNGWNNGYYIPDNKYGSLGERSPQLHRNHYDVIAWMYIPEVPTESPEPKPVKLTLHSDPDVIKQIDTLQRELIEHIGRRREEKKKKLIEYLKNEKESIPSAEVEFCLNRVIKSIECLW